jgi:cytochrome c-type biogenesis protein CcmH
MIFAVLRRYVATILFALMLGAQALAVEPGERLADPAQETRARALSAELRCLVCQNQSIDDSNAPLAKDLRVLVREQIKAGRSDNEVMSYIVARYGDFVLLRPRMTWSTALLWLTPILILSTVGYLLLQRRRQGLAAEAPPLTADEQRRLDALLKSKDRP